MCRRVSNLRKRSPIKPSLLSAWAGLLGTRRLSLLQKADAATLFGCAEGGLHRAAGATTRLKAIEVRGQGDFTEILWIAVTLLYTHA